MIELIGALVVLIGMGYLALTWFLARSPHEPQQNGSVPKQIWFIVPCLDEERVIGQTVRNLMGLDLELTRVLVVNDGSTDGSAQVLEQAKARYGERLQVLTRELPYAKRGKGAALNDAYCAVRELVSEEGLDPSDVIVGIVDADGRLSETSVECIVKHFTDPLVGGLQLLVRIRDRHRTMLRLQDYEFVTYSTITQVAREKLGSVGLGGNGQFTRLVCLEQLGDAPWRDCLTEDLDIGMRITLNGWQNRFSKASFVDQQGVPETKRYIRQRTRWAQGHFQCWALMSTVLKSRLPSVTLIDLMHHLFAPVISLIGAAVFAFANVWLWISVFVNPDIWITPLGVLVAVGLYVFSFGPSVLMALHYRKVSGELSVVRAIFLGNVVVGYHWLGYFALAKGLVRQLSGRKSWAKTARMVEAPPEEGKTVVLA